MPGSAQFKTGWIRVATEGETFNNVPIERQWLVDIAETYHPETYGARIWPDHRRWYGAWGDVLEAKTEEEGGKLRLYVQIRPNADLIYANQQDQKVYTSIEVQPDFAGTGKAYLTGLGVTDEPASLGTERLKFSARDRFETHKYGAPEQFVMDELIEEKSGVMKRLLQMFNTSETPEQEKPMDKQQFSQLTDTLTKLSEGQTALQAQLQKFAAEPEEPPEGKPEEGKPEAGKGQEGQSQGDKQDTITTEQFTQLTDAIAKLADGQTALGEQFGKLLQEKPGQQPDGSGGGDDSAISLV